MRRRNKLKHQIEYVDAELNIMPFIDVFSVLNTFLLFSAVFVAFGVVKVQVPYFSNKQSETKPKRTFDVKVTLAKTEVLLNTSYTMAPINEVKQTFKADKAGFAELHQRLVAARQANQDTDMITLFTDDDVPYELMVEALDAIKLRKENDPEFQTENDDDEKEIVNKNYLYPKVIMGSVIL